MIDSNERWDEQMLARRLKAEADGPAFSASLHERIMQEVKRASRPQSAGERASANFRLSLAIAAMLAVAVMWVGVSSWRSPAPSQIVRTPMPTLPSVDNLLALTDSPADKRLQQAQYAYLDRDARRLTAYVMDELNFSPVK